MKEEELQKQPAPGAHYVAPSQRANLEATPHFGAHSRKVHSSERISERRERILEASPRGAHLEALGAYFEVTSPTQQVPPLQKRSDKKDMVFIHPFTMMIYGSSGIIILILFSVKFLFNAFKQGPYTKMKLSLRSVV